ncbi:MAG TPA: hypothetical protein PKY81_12025 [bacterium]|nr:hypothetical protein [bacterium]HPN31672.1 hypothetical protein [bacterium]
MSKKHLLFGLIIVIIIFYSLPLFFIKNILASHDEKFIIDLTLSLPLNKFAMPVNYYGPLQSYILLFFYSLLLIPGYLFNNGGIDYVKNIYVNNPQILLLISKIASFLLFVSSIYIWKIIAQKTNWRFSTKLFLILTLFFTPILYSFATTVKVELLAILLVSLIILCYLNYSEKPTIYNFIMLSVSTALLFSVKYNLIVLAVIPLSIFVLNFFSHKSLKRVIVTLFSFSILVILAITISMPVLIIQPKIFISDFKYIFSILELGHIGWQFDNSPIANLKSFINIFYLNMPAIFFIILPLAIFYFIKLKKNIPIIVGIFIFFIFMFKWKFKLAHYFLPVIPFILFISADYFDKLQTRKLRIIILLFLFVSIFHIKHSISYLKTYFVKDNRIITKEYIEKNIPAGSRILLEDIYNYSPYILPSEMPVEYDAPDGEHRKRLKRKYFQLLIDYGKAPKYKLTFLNVPLEGKRLLTFDFPDENYLRANFDYAIINRNISSRFENLKSKNQNGFIEKARHFYFNVLDKLNCERGGYFKIYKTSK